MLWSKVYFSLLLVWGLVKQALSGTWLNFNSTWMSLLFCSCKQMQKFKTFLYILSFSRLKNYINVNSLGTLCWAWSPSFNCYDAFVSFNRFLLSSWFTKSDLNPGWFYLIESRRTIHTSVEPKFLTIEICQTLNWRNWGCNLLLGCFECHIFFISSIFIWFGTLYFESWMGSLIEVHLTALAAVLSCGN